MPPGHLLPMSMNESYHKEQQGINLSFFFISVKVSKNSASNLGVHSLKQLYTRHD